MQYPTTNNNAAAFLLDGDEYFTRLHQSLRPLLAGGAAANTYVRMAFWQFSPDTFLPGYATLAGWQAGVYLRDILSALASQGIIVQLIAWSGARGVRMFNAEMASNWKMRDWVRAENARLNGVGAYRPIDLYMESYGQRFGVGTSTHQKIIIISNAGAREAFIGGMNLAQKYLSSEHHDPMNWWHDTAVHVTGDATFHIETEWVRRWNKQNGGGPVPNGAIVAAAGGGGGIAITPYTTNYEANPAETSIRQQLIARINGANNYVYLENYALTDPFVVGALHARMNAVPGLQVIAVVNHPRNQVMEGFETFAYLMYYTYMELSLADFASIDTVDTWRAYLGRNPRNIPLANIAAAAVDKGAINPNTAAMFNPANSYSYQFNETVGGVVTARDIAFKHIWNIAPNRNFMFAPKTAQLPGDDQNKWAYPHSKLALIDDQYTFIGTSNWTYRSMQYDAEISLEIDDVAFATATRNRLFGHWNQPQDGGGAVGWHYPTWNGAAAANQVAFAAGQVPLNETRIVPLGYADFIHPQSFESWRKLATNGGFLLSAYF